MNFVSLSWLAALSIVAATLVAPSGPASAQAPRPAPRPAEAQPLRAPASAAPAATPAATQAALPGGASSLQETHGDWQVACVVQAQAKRCGLTQEQTNAQNRQRVLAVELVPSGDKADGILVLPFGLVLDQGVSLQIDDQPAGQPLRFRTCLPAGCLVQLSFDARAMAALRAGTVLKAKVVADSGQETVFSVSLKGLASGLERTARLSQ